MEARIVQLPSPPPELRPAVRIADDRIVVERLTVADPQLADYLRERPEDDRTAIVARALRIGLLALQDAGVTVNVDVVRGEFDRLLHRAEQANERAATTLEQTLRTNFADGDGRLPRTLEKFLGNRGALRSMVDELFDEKKRDSAIGRISRMLETYFDGDASKLAALLDPTRLNSPMHQFREEIAAGFKDIGDRLLALEVAATARATERSKSAAKGGDFEDVLEALLGDIARGAGDLVERTADAAGATMRSKKGDFVLSINPMLTHGADLRIVIEAKDRKVSGREMRDELREARTNRSAAVALVVFTPAHAPTGIAPFDVRGGDVYCVVDPAAPDVASLEAAVRLARLVAIATMHEAEAEVDAAAIRTALTGIREQLDAIRTLKAHLTSISNAAGNVSGGLDRLRDNVLGLVLEAETELAATRSGAA
jgi:hypothetical protein